MPGCKTVVFHSEGRVEGGEEGGVLVLHQLEQCVVENLPSVHQILTSQLSLTWCLAQAFTLK